MVDTQEHRLNFAQQQLQRIWLSGCPITYCKGGLESSLSSKHNGKVLENINTGPRVQRVSIANLLQKVILAGLIGSKKEIKTITSAAPLRTSIIESVLIKYK